MSRYILESREYALGNGLIARIDWEYDQDGFSACDYLGEYQAQRDEYVIDRVEGMFLGKVVDGFFRISLHHLGLKAENNSVWKSYSLTQQEWQKVEKEIDQRLKKLKVWVPSYRDLDYQISEKNPNLVEVDYWGYELLADGLGRTCFDEYRQYRYYKPSSNYCPPENADEVRYCIEDWRRLEAFNNGDWYMTGCVVTILVGSDDDDADDFVLGYSSVWGVESDCDEEDRREIERDQLYLALLDAQKNVGGIEAQAKTLQEFADKLRGMKPDELMKVFEELEVEP